MICDFNLKGWFCLDGGYGLIWMTQDNSAPLEVRICLHRVSSVDPNNQQGEIRDLYSTSLLGISAVQNSHPHTELDFGTVLWTSAGTRLLEEAGWVHSLPSTSHCLRYASIGKDYYSQDAPDQNALGHNTLVVRNAQWPLGDNTSEASQIKDMVDGDRNFNPLS